jgi:tRNA pseudouridine13 synthase
VDLDGKVIHLKSIGKPVSPGNENDEVSVPDALKQEDAMDILPDSTAGTGSSTQQTDGDSSQKPYALVWQDHFTIALAPFLDPERMQQVKDMYLQGRSPPRVSDSGWAGRKAKLPDEETGFAQTVEPTTTPSVEQSHKAGGRNKKIELDGSKMVDDRKMVSEVLVSEILNLHPLDLIMLSFSP